MESATIKVVRCWMGSSQYKLKNHVSKTSVERHNEGRGAEVENSTKNKQENSADQPQAYLERPTSPDQGYEIARKALGILKEAGHEARLAGGCVRDRLLGLVPKDYDIATTAHPEAICLAFKQKGVKTVPTGIDHGTITVVMKGVALEVTSLRSDVETDGRRAKVVFGISFREDAARRDFTMNAMYEDEQYGLYDYFGGAEDLSKKVLRFVGDPLLRIREDYLRILRCFRFWARFQFRPDDETLLALKQEANGLAQLSQERVCTEIIQILSEASIENVVEAMLSCGVLEQVLGFRPSLKTIAQIDAYKSITKAERSGARLALLLLEYPRKDELGEYLKAFRLSGRQIQQILLWLVPPSSVNVGKDLATPMQVLDRWQRAWPQQDLTEALAVYQLLYPDASEPRVLAVTEKDFGMRRRQPMPLKGHDLSKDLGLAAGPLLGQLLQHLLESFRNGEWQTQKEGLERAREYLANAGTRPT